MELTMSEITVYDYENPVYRVLLENKLFMGIGLGAFTFIAIITIVLMTVVSIYSVIAGVVLVIAARLVCRKDPMTLQILFERLLTPDIWRAD